ncbi:helix-turn-helix domain-containing protein [Neisseriaceae bacterium B1]
MKINEKIKLLRENHHWSQEKLAQKLNMSKNGYAKIERGETRPSLQRLEQIATVLDMDICELLSFGGSQTVSYLGNHLNCSNIIVGDANQEFLLQHHRRRCQSRIFVATLSTNHCFKRRSDCQQRQYYRCPASRD